MKKRSDRYKDSPTMERDGDSGKMEVKKNSPTAAEKDSARVNSGTDGMQEHDQAVMKLHQKHAKERMDMHHKHEKEHLSLMQKAMPAAPAGEDKGSGDGDEKIQKVESGEE